MTRHDYIDPNLLAQIVQINTLNAVVMFFIAYLFFYLFPRWLFPQQWSGVGLERTISNILYVLVYIEIFVPIFIFLKVFSLAFFIAFILLTKLFFLKVFEKKEVGKSVRSTVDRWLIALFNFFDDIPGHLDRLRKKLKKRVEDYFVQTPTLRMVQQGLTLLIFVYLIYTVGYRCFIGMANPLPDTSQFVEWVANMKNNIFWSDFKTPGTDFYGISLFIFIIHRLTNIDSIVLFNIYPLLLITFLFLGTYFVLSKFTSSWFATIATLLVYGAILISSPWNEELATYIATTNAPEILRFFGLRFYDIPRDPNLFTEPVGMYPYIRYFSGMAYEFASAFFLINLYYLIRTLATGRYRYLINYTLSLMLVFIFHGGGAIVLIVPSILIALHAFISKKLTKELFFKGLGAVVLGAILGNGWMLSALKYGIPQDFGVAAPFLDYLFGTEQAMEEIASSGIEAVVISKLRVIHLFIFLVVVTLFAVKRVQRNGFFYSSFLLIPIGVMGVYFAQNLGFSQLVHPYRAVEYFMLSLTIPVACFFYYLERFLRFSFKKVYRVSTLAVVIAVFLATALFVPKYYESERFYKYINYTQYSDIPFYLYKIVKEFRPKTWTVVSYVQEYSKSLGKGFMINVNDFLMKYDPRAPYLEIPTKYIFIFIEDLPHTYRGSGDWFYRWRQDIQTKLKEWVAIYSLTHPNIKVFGKTNLLTVYMIDNSKYLQLLERKNANE